jgi:LPPG:FO 2-phospho-L-lactate transferase
VVLGPSNPAASILPILKLPGVRESVAAQRCVAVTPTVSGVPIIDEGERRRATSRAAMLASMGVAHRAGAVAALYAELIDAFVVDEADADDVDAIREALPEIEVGCADTIIGDEATGDRLAAHLLATPAGPTRNRDRTAEREPVASEKG